MQAQAVEDVLEWLLHDLLVDDLKRLLPWEATGYYPTSLMRELIATLPPKGGVSF